MEPWHVALVAALLGLFAAELLLGLFILERGGRGTPARILGAFLLVHAIGAALTLTFSLLAQGPVPPSPRPASLLLLCSVFLLLPAILVLFALEYPAAHPAVRAFPWLRALPFLPVALIPAYTLFVPGAWTWTMTREPAPGQSYSVTYEVLPILTGASLLIGFIAAVAIFAYRLRATRTALMRQRLRFMALAVAVPLMVAMTIFIALLAIDALLFLQSGGMAVPGPAMIAFATAALLILLLVPPFALALGLLRYKVLDIDTRIRVTVRRGFVGSAFIAVFFAASEIAAALFTEGTGTWFLGILAASLLVFLLAPLQRTGERIAQRLLPVTDDARYQEFRRWEMYRATFEDLIADGEISKADRRVLSAMARNLGLDAAAVRSIEKATRRELADEDPATVDRRSPESG